MQLTVCVVYTVCMLCRCQLIWPSTYFSLSVCRAEWPFVNCTLGPSSTPSPYWEFTSSTRNCFNRPAKRLHRKSEPMLTVTCSYLLGGRNECVEPQGPLCNATKGQWGSPACYNCMENGQNEWAFLELSSVKTEVRGWGSSVKVDVKAGDCSSR